MKKNIFLAFLVMMIFSLIKVSAYAKTVEYSYSQANASTEWSKFGETDYVNFEENGIFHTNYSGEFSAIYDKEVFEGIEYKITLQNKSRGKNNAMIVYFNYQDSSNYYCFTIGGSDGSEEPNPVKLIKAVNGEKNELAEYEHYNIHYKPREFKVVCSNGNIMVTVTDGDLETELFSVSDNTFESGKIGIGGKHVWGEFTGISVSGIVNSYLKVTNTTPTDSDINVPYPVNPVINFDKAINGETVTNNSIYVMADDVSLLENMYDVIPYESSVEIIIREMQENTNYKIVVTTDVKTFDMESLKEPYVLSFETYKGEDYMEYNYNINNISDWEVPSTTYFAPIEDGITSNDYAAKFDVILNSYIFRDEFIYSMNVTDSGGGSTNVAKMFFNYVDSSNYYCLTIGGTNDGNYPLTLSKNVGGEESSMGISTVSWGALVKIKYKNNKIVIYADDELKIEVEDSTFTNGYIGVGVAYTKATFTNIKIAGFGKNVQLKNTSESNITNGDTDVPLDTVVELVFNFSLKERVVTKDNIYVTENSKIMDTDLYELNLEDNDKKVVIVFKNKLKEKTDYSIEISDKVVSVEYGVGLPEAKRSIAFRTKPPVYDVQSSSVKYFDTESNEYTEVSDMAQMGSKDVKFNISVKNNGSEPQSFAISAMIVQADGEIIGAKYYAANLAAGAEFEKDMEDTDNTIAVPLTVEAGAKMIYFVWDSFTNMISLYPSGEF